MLRLLSICVPLLFSAFSATAQSDTSGLISLDDRRATQGWEAVGKLTIGRGGLCTATLIQDYLLLTAAHCVYDDNDRLRPPSDFIFQAAFRNGRAEATRRVVRVVPHPDFVSEGDTISRDAIATDIAVLELAQAIRLTSVQPFAISARPRRGDEVAIVSYGGTRSNAPSLQKSCSVLGVDQGAVVMDCNIEKGSSGSPVFRVQDGKTTIASVVSAGSSSRDARYAFGTSLQEPLQLLLAEFASRRPAQPGGQQRIHSITERNNTGAKFVSSGN